MSEDRIALLLSWRHSGFSVHNTVRVAAGDTAGVERFDPAELLARLLQHVPEPRLHQVRYYGRYSHVARARRNVDDREALPEVALPEEEPDTAERRQARRGHRAAKRRGRAQLIRRVYEVDPLICQECGGEMRIVAFLLDPLAIRKILTHLARRACRPPRGPPATSNGRVNGRVRAVS